MINWLNNFSFSYQGVIILFSHIVIGADDTEKAKGFYDATLGALGYEPGAMTDTGRVMYMTEEHIFAVTKPINGKPAGVGNGETIGFIAKSAEQCDAWHAAGVANGGTAIEDPPGVREMGELKFYLAYLLDPAGHKLCTMYRM